MENKASWFLTASLGIVILLIVFGSRFFITVPAGHVGVASLFGEVQQEPFKEGLHIPVNPLYKWTMYDTRQKTLAEIAMVPSQDQLQTKIEISVQYYIKGDMAPSILRMTGTASDTIDVHLKPQLRSSIREHGKSIKCAEDFFQEKTQNLLQTAVLAGLQAYLESKGIEIQAVLIRDITLPEFITKAIESKKERVQAVEKQAAELERYRTEQKQIVAAAEAERLAAEQLAVQRRTLADAQAYEIQKLNEAIADNQAYIQLKALEALEKISQNPASQIYFLNSDSHAPLPLMHLGNAASQQH